MNSEKLVKVFVVFLIAYLISSLVLLFAGLISQIVFWVVIALAAIFAFIVLPRINKRISEN